MRILMIDAIIYADILKRIRENEFIGDIIGILVTQPNLHIRNCI